MKPGLLLALPGWPALAAAREEEEPAIAFILAYNPVVVAPRYATPPPPGALRRVMEHTSFYVRAASGTSSTVSDGGDTTTGSDNHPEQTPSKRGCTPSTLTRRSAIPQRIRAPGGTNQTESERMIPRVRLVRPKAEVSSMGAANAAGVFDTGGGSDCRASYISINPRISTRLNMMRAPSNVGAVLAQIGNGVVDFNSSHRCIPLRGLPTWIFDEEVARNEAALSPSKAPSVTT